LTAAAFGPRAGHDGEWLAQRSDMSKHNNANWDHYKVAGREHPGDDVHHEEERQQFAGSKAHAEQANQQGPHIPNQERASQPGGAETSGERDRDDAADAQNITGNEDTEPTLSDDEGYTG
jgi:hypothetical protein